MQKRFLFLFLTGFSLVSHGQTDSVNVLAKYAFTHIMDTTQPDNPLKETMVLFIGSRLSNYTSWDRIERNLAAKKEVKGEVAATNSAPASLDADMSSIKSVSVNGGMVTMTNANGSVTTLNMSASYLATNSYYKDLQTSSLSYIGMAGGKLYDVAEKMPAIEWSIAPDTKEIHGLACQKATCHFRGRDYEAWFCSQLPYSNGPWKLGGLPGLILEASDSKKEVVFNFISFENATGPKTPIELPPTALKTTPREYAQYTEAIARNRQAGSGAVEGVSVSNVRISAANMPAGMAPAKIRRMNNPIEKELK